MGSGGGVEPRFDLRNQGTGPIRDAGHVRAGTGKSSGVALVQQALPFSDYRGGQPIFAAKGPGQLGRRLHLGWDAESKREILAQHPGTPIWREIGGCQLALGPSADGGLISRRGR